MFVLSILRCFSVDAQLPKVAEGVNRFVSDTAGLAAKDPEEFIRLFKVRPVDLCYGIKFVAGRLRCKFDRWLPTKNVRVDSCSPFSPGICSYDSEEAA